MLQYLQIDINKYTKSNTYVYTIHMLYLDVFFAKGNKSAVNVVLVKNVVKVLYIKLGAYSFRIIIGGIKSIKWKRMVLDIKEIISKNTFEADMCIK